MHPIYKRDSDNYYKWTRIQHALNICKELVVLERVNVKTNKDENKVVKISNERIHMWEINMVNEVLEEARS